MASETEDKATVMLFTSPTCQHCPAAKRIISEFVKERDDFEYQELSTASKEGSRKAKKYGVMSVPTFLITGPAASDIIGLRGVQSKNTLNRKIDEVLGVKNNSSSKGFFSKITGMLK